jgi:shikimate kinase
VVQRGQNRYAAKFLPGVNLYLVGFMATGKSTVGRALAGRLGYEFYDSDIEIERLKKMSIPEIFEKEGEGAFRRYERDFIDGGHPDSRCVVACGGGLITQPGMIDLLKQKGVVICLYATTRTILQRTQGNKSRPLLDVDDPEKRIADLLAEREPFYRQAGTLVLTDNRSLSSVVEHLRRIYLRDASAFLARRNEDAAGNGSSSD